MHFPNKKIIELPFIEMGLFYEHFTCGRSETPPKNIAQIYIPWYVSTVFLFFESSVYFFLNFKDGDVSKIPLLFFFALQATK